MPPSTMIIPILATVIYLVWLFAERAFSSSREGNATRKNMDRSSRAWARAALLVGLPLGLVVGFTHIGELRQGRQVISLLGLLVLLSGIPIRYLAMVTLKGFYTPEVMIADDHQVVTTGIYNFVRHPAYLGYLLIHLGLGLSFGNWLTVLIIFLPVLGGVMYRIKVEDAALKESLGHSYINYAKTTKRLIPKVY
jgi:protein-S-isoprenylcysteine O-methyltransferase Ste14